MRKQVFILLTVVSLVFGVCLPAVAQITELGARVDGVVKDADGKPVEKAQVEFYNNESGRRFPAKTDKNGKYNFLALPPGQRYTVTVKVDGKEVWKKEKHALFAGQEETLDITLQPAAPPQTAAAPAQGGQKKGKEQQQMSKEEIERIQKENEKIKAENAKIGVLNTAIMQARTDLKAQPPLVDKAITDMEAATAAAPEYDLGWVTLGDAYMAAKNWPKAIEAYTKAIELVPVEKKNAIAPYHNNLGRAYGQTGQGEKAIEQYTKAAELDPTNASMYYFNAGATLTNSNKLDDANIAFDKCLAALKNIPAPADPNVAANLKKREADATYLKSVNLMSKGTLSKDGKYEAPPGTAEGFNRYLELQPTGQYAEVAKQMLTTIGAPVQTTYGAEKKKKK